MHVERCAAMHLGLWLAHNPWLEEAMKAVKAGIWPVLQQPELRYMLLVAAEQVDVEPTPVSASGDARPYALDRNGTAVIPIDGQLQKGSSKYGGTSSLAVRRALRIAREDPEVQAIMLHIDSPGGTVAGTDDLAEETRAAGALKPIAAHIDDLGASAAYWVASQTDFITASKTSEVGSIGTFAVLHDTSARYQAEGIQVHVVSTGPYKGALVDGVPVSEPALAEIRERVSAVNEHFLSAVQRGRGLRRGKLEELATGQVWIAEKAKENGLIDGVMSFDAAMGRLRKQPAKTQKKYSMDVEIAEAELDQSRLGG